MVNECRPAAVSDISPVQSVRRVPVQSVGPVPGPIQNRRGRNQKEKASSMPAVPILRSLAPPRFTIHDPRFTAPRSLAPLFPRSLVPLFPRSLVPLFPCSLLLPTPHPVFTPPHPLAGPTPHAVL
jgi:hypothetical protein